MNDTTELPDAIRLPLHRLWADAGYLIGRARQETDPERFVTIIKSRCEEIEAAYRADRAERAAPAWQPIETAPRDGTSVLIFLPESTRAKVREASWAVPWDGAPAEQCFWVTPTGPGGRGYMILPLAVTRWMPLPAGPDPSSGAEGSGNG